MFILVHLRKKPKAKGNAAEWTKTGRAEYPPRGRMFGDMQSLAAPVQTGEEVFVFLIHLPPVCCQGYSSPPGRSIILSHVSS